MIRFGYLLGDCSRQLRKLFDIRMRANGVTGPQARLLLLLETDEGQQQGYYANYLDVEPISLCRMVDRMEEAGLTERRVDPNDRRARLIYRTERAKEITPRLRAQTDRLLEEISTAFRAEERTALTDLLSRLSTGLAQMNEKENSSHG